jgi:transposase
MWKPYLKLIALRAKSALNILDRFHIAKKLGDAIDDVRVAETKELMRQGKNVLLKYSRWCFLKNPENLTENQKVKLRDLLKCNLKTIRAYLLKEDFQAFWDYVSPLWAGKFLDQWCSQVMRSRLEPMKKVAKTIRAHKQLILNWFEAKNVISLGAVEGQNNKAKVVIRKSYGFKTSEMLKISLYHKLGKLPVPELAHDYL